jgi:hypothetical protein
MTKQLKIWLWLSIAFTAAGAFLLYPIGKTALNILFLIIKIGMLTGLLILLFRKKKCGLFLWVLFSAGAVVMAVLKWYLAGSASFLIISSIVVDVFMPVVACFWVQNQPNEFQ